MNDNCKFWRAQWDGELCHLLSSDYQHVSTTGTILYEITNLTLSRIVNLLLEPSTGWTALKDQSLAMPLWRMTVSTVEREWVRMKVYHTLCDALVGQLSKSLVPF